MSYQRVVLTEFGGPEKLQLVREESLPEPGPGQIRVKVLCAGTGFTDTIIRQGQYPDVRQKPPFTPGYEWVGVVDKLGAGARHFKLGKMVADMSVTGGYTQYLCVDEDRVIAAPEGVHPAQSVCIPLSYATAYQMLTRYRKIPAGSTCLVHAAGGAVGTALLDLGRLMNLNMIASASAGKHELVQAYGAEAIDYRREDFVKRTRELTGRRGVDVVFDTIGGRNFERSYRCLARGGLLIGFGALQWTTGEEKLFSLWRGFAKLMLLWPLLPDGRKAVFYNIHRRRNKFPDDYKQDVEKLFSLLKAGKLKPAIAACRPLADVVEVHRMIDAAAPAGKIVLACHQEAECHGKQ